MPLRRHGFFVDFGEGFGVGLPGLMPLRRHGFFVGLGEGFAICAAGLTFAIGAFAAMAVPVMRKAAAVNDASSCFKVCSSFP